MVRWATDPRPFWLPLVGASGLAWFGMISNSKSFGFEGMCCVPTTVKAAFSGNFLHALLWLNPPVQVLGAWFLMIVAMMTPTLAHGIRSIWDRSFARRRLRASLLFVAGYLVLWTVVGALIVPTALAVRLASGDGLIGVIAVVLIALAWQCSPAKKICLNRMHAPGSLEAFGLRADRDALKQGVVHGFWCLGSCWALMLAVETIPVGHSIAMALVMVWLMLEQSEHIKAIRWQPAGLAKLTGLLKLAKLG